MRNAKQWLFDLLARCNETQAIDVSVVCLAHLGSLQYDVRNSETNLCPRMIINKIQVYVDMIVMHCRKPDQSIRACLVGCIKPNQARVGWKKHVWLLVKSLGSHEHDT